MEASGRIYAGEKQLSKFSFLIIKVSLVPSSQFRGQVPKAISRRRKNNGGHNSVILT